jgi:PleD family two-component response regulator
LGERLRATVESSRIPYLSTSIAITISLGFVVIEPQVAVSLDDLRTAASGALAEAKGTGRNRCVVHRLPTTISPARHSPVETGS